MLLLRCGPRKVGIAQNPQDRSHPSAIFTYAHGLSAFGLGRLSRSKTGISSVDVFGRELNVTGTPNPAIPSTSGNASESSFP